eukprot:351134-Chlamydomonas_euryale.AAC.10
METAAWADARPRHGRRAFHCSCSWSAGMHTQLAKFVTHSTNSSPPHFLLARVTIRNVVAHSVHMARSERRPGFQRHAVHELPTNPWSVPTTIELGWRLSNPWPEPRLPSLFDPGELPWRASLNLSYSQFTYVVEVMVS